MKVMVHAQKMNTKEELPRQILSAARRINNAAVLRTLKRLLVKRVRKCIKQIEVTLKNLR
jgi:arginine repressor